MGVVIDEVFVSLIGNDYEVALNRECGNFLRLAAREYKSAGILWGVVVDGPRLWSGKLLQSIANSIATGRDCRNQQRPGLRSGNKVANGRPVWGEDQRIVAGIEHALEGSV